MQAHQALIDRLKFKFLITYHSYGPLHPLSVRLAGPDAVGGRPALRGAVRHRRESGDQRLRPRRRRRPLHHERHDRRLLVREDRARCRGRSSSNEGCDGCGFVFPDDEALVQARVREEPAVRARPRALGTEPESAGVASRQHGQALLPRHGQGREVPAGRARSREDEQPGERLHVLRLVRRPAARARARQARPERRRHRRRRLGQVRDHAERRRAAGADRRDEPVERRRARRRSATSTTT